METVTVLVPFTVEYETHGLDTFQRAGHFVPGMTDEEQRRREFCGETVHVLVLKHLGAQVLRVVADSLPEAERLMSGNIRDTLLALWTAQQSTVFSYDQMKRLVDRQAEFQAFMNARFPHHAKTGDVYDWAMFYLSGDGGQ